MPSLASFNSASIKALNVGKPGAGKTGALMSILLDDPEARLFIANFDRGNIGTLAGLARTDPKTGAARPPAVTADLLRRIQFKNFDDEIRVVNGVPLLIGATAFAGVGNCLNKWVDEETGENFGALHDWGPRDWFVYDSISAMGESALRATAKAAGKLNQRLEQSHWGDAINRISLLLEMTNDPSIRCNIMANTHVRYVGDLESGVDEKGKPRELDMVPNALGQKLPQEIGRYFNNIIETRQIGEGPGAQRLIHTRPPGGLTLRSSNPGAVKPTYDLYTGMAQWVRDLRSTPPAGSVPATPPAVGATPPTPAAGPTPAPAN